MKRKQIDPYKYLAVFAVTTLIFVIGVVVGHQINVTKVDQLESVRNEIQSSTIGTELAYRIREENPCAQINSTRFASQIGELGKKLTYMEEQLGKNDPQVINLKEYYSLLEIRDWFFLKEVREECQLDYSLVLYFYSNEEDCERCEDQGHVLSYVHDKKPGFNIYSFDVNIDNPALDALKETYGIDTTPTIVIDGEVHEGFTPRKELIALLEN